MQPRTAGRGYDCWYFLGLSNARTHGYGWSRQRINMVLKVSLQITEGRAETPGEEARISQAWGSIDGLTDILLERRDAELPFLRQL